MNDTSFLDDDACVNGADERYYFEMQGSYEHTETNAQHGEIYVTL